MIKLKLSKILNDLCSLGTITIQHYNNKFYISFKPFEYNTHLQEINEYNINYFTALLNIHRRIY